MGEERLPLIWTRGSWILIPMVRRGTERRDERGRRKGTGEGIYEKVKHGSGVRDKVEVEVAPPEKTQTWVGGTAKLPT